MKKIEKIPATKKPKEEFPVNTKKKAAAYVRVSTMHEEQQHSLESQTNYYEKYIKRNKDWVYTGIYADNGISGGSLKSRKEFQRINAWWVRFCTCNTYYFYGCGSCNRCNYCCNGKIQTQ